MIFLGPRFLDFFSLLVTFLSPSVFAMEPFLLDDEGADMNDLAGRALFALRFSSLTSLEEIGRFVAGAFLDLERGAVLG
jgi:hypothetical protein